MFILKEDGVLVPLKATQFVQEDHFQQLLEDYPDLLAGELIDPEDPRQWLLIAREIAVPNEANNGIGWWSADHLFLDQDGIPTIVEVKRQTDSRLRREVVAQMLDYAANGVAGWSLDTIRSSFEATYQKKGKDHEQELHEKLGHENAEKFWLQVKTNLEAQKIRLLFVADVIPRELKRIVEFLNRQMNPAEVLALELKQYAGENGLRMLAPTLFGQTEEARGIKAASPGRNWDETSFFAELEARSDASVVTTARQILGWIEKNAMPIYGHGKVDGSIAACFSALGGKLYPLTLSTQGGGKAYINFASCLKPPFDNEALRVQWLTQLNQVPGIKLAPDAIFKMPPVQLATLAVENRTDQFLAAMDWFVSKISSVSGTPQHEIDSA